MSHKQMNWICKLSEVGDPILAARARLDHLAQEAHKLEALALAMREQLVAERTGLRLRVAKHWSAQDIALAQAAAAPAPRQRPCEAFLLDTVDDPVMRAHLSRLDGSHLAAEALIAFHAAGVLRQHNLLSTASTVERSDTLLRVLEWWNIAARPVFDRLDGERRSSVLSASIASEHRV